MPAVKSNNARQYLTHQSRADLSRQVRQLMQLQSKLQPTSKGSSHTAVTQLEDGYIHDSGSGPQLQGYSDKANNVNVKKTKVDYISGKVTTTKEKVGISMVANPIGPDHPAGAEPSSSATRDHIRKHVGKKDTFIRGHLLNGDLGGPGEAANLFPITAMANSHHYQKVEKTAKSLINDQKAWARYEVKVINRDDANGIADFSCELAPIDSNGADTKWLLSGTIHSAPQNSSSNVQTNSLSNQNAIVTDTTNFGDDDIEYSSGKTPKGYKPISQDIEELMVKDSQKDTLGMTTLVWKLTSSSYGINMNDDSAEEIQSYVDSGDTSVFMNTQKSTWNKWVNKINANYH